MCLAGRSTAVRPRVRCSLPAWPSSHPLCQLPFPPPVLFALLACLRANDPSQPSNRPLAARSAIFATSTSTFIVGTVVASVAAPNFVGKYGVPNMHRPLRMLHARARRACCGHTLTLNPSITHPPTLAAPHRAVPTGNNLGAMGSRAQATFLVSAAGRQQRGASPPLPQHQRQRAAEPPACAARPNASCTPSRRLGHADQPAGAALHAHELPQERGQAVLHLLRLSVSLRACDRQLGWRATYALCCCPILSVSPERLAGSCALPCRRGDDWAGAAFVVAFAVDEKCAGKLPAFKCAAPPLQRVCRAWRARCFGRSAPCAAPSCRVPACLPDLLPPAPPANNLLQAAHHRRWRRRRRQAPQGQRLRG